MDELELLKKDWQHNPIEYPELSYDEIYKMSHAKSSSIVKWIFYISLIELSIGLLLLIINPKVDDSVVAYPKWVETITYFSIPVIIFFIYQFYKNYKTITTTDNVKKLIQSILKTRQTVKYYVIFNLIFGALIAAVGIYIGYVTTHGGAEAFSASAHFKEYAALGIAIVLITGFIVAFVYGIYYLLYGILLKRLNKNYKELKKLEL